MKDCKHNSYWRTVYGNCMACRAELAEAQLAASQEEGERLRLALSARSSASPDVGVIAETLRGVPMRVKGNDRPRYQPDLVPDYQRMAEAVHALLTARHPFYDTRTGYEAQWCVHCSWWVGAERRKR